MKGTLLNFRGRKDGKWVYATGMARDPETDETVLINYQKDKPVEIIHIDENSLSLAIGYLDRNRKMIYEGDVIAINGTTSKKLIRYNNRLHSMAMINPKEFSAFHKKDERWLEMLWAPSEVSWWKEFEDSVEIIGDMYSVDILTEILQDFIDEK